MSQLKLTADSGGGTVAIKGPASTTGNGAIELTVPGTASGNLLTTTNSQVVTTNKTDTFSTTSTSKVDITGMSVTITPSSSSSKIMVFAEINHGGFNYNFYLDLLRDSTRLRIPASGNNPATIQAPGISDASNYTWTMWTRTIALLDTPATASAVTYKLQVACQSGGEFFLNRPRRSGNAVDGVCGSSITVMEVAA